MDEGTFVSFSEIIADNKRRLQKRRIAKVKYFLTDMKYYLTNAALLALALVVGVFLMDKMLDASEQEDCWRMQRQHDAGYPVTVPEWCEAK